MKIRTNSPTVLDLVIRLLTQNGIAVRKLVGNEIQVTTEDVTEGEIRSLLQEKLDENKFDFEDDFVLVEGNSVWSYKMIMKEIKAIKKADSTSGITGYFYKFMNLNFTSAEGNMRGWMVEYPSFDKVVKLLSNSDVPDWKTDVAKILTEIKTKENVAHN
jgi:hypothetical protein